MTKRKIAKRVVTTRAQLHKLIEEATGRLPRRGRTIFNKIEDARAVPFVTRILGVEVSVVAVEMGEDGSLKAVCAHGGERQQIVLLDLPLTPQLPVGAQRIAAYRRWVQGR